MKIVLLIATALLSGCIFIADRPANAATWDHCTVLVTDAFGATAWVPCEAVYGDTLWVTQGGRRILEFKKRADEPAPSSTPWAIDWSATTTVPLWSTVFMSSEHDGRWRVLARQVGYGFRNGEERCWHRGSGRLEDDPDAGWRELNLFKHPDGGHFGCFPDSEWRAVYYPDSRRRIRLTLEVEEPNTKPIKETLKCQPSTK